MKNTKAIKIESCLDCPNHSIIPDPDPNDWFCDDDIAIVCKEVPNPKQDLCSKYVSNRSEFRSITCACRPYNDRKESNIPDWCPLT